MKTAMENMYTETEKLSKVNDVLSVSHSHVKDLTVTPIRNRKNTYRITGYQVNEFTGEHVSNVDFRATVHGNGDVQLWIPGHGTFAIHTQ